VRALLIVIISRIEDTKETPSRARIGSNDDNATRRPIEAQTLFSTSEPYRMRLFLRASARTLLNFHCVRVTMSYQISWRILLQSSSSGIIRDSANTLINCSRLPAISDTLSIPEGCTTIDYSTLSAKSDTLSASSSICNKCIN
jgi:hypothetical protein